jgi:hypothetical protein
MAVYTSAFTGPQIDDGITKGLSAVQPDTIDGLTLAGLAGVSIPDPVPESGVLIWNEGTALWEARTPTLNDLENVVYAPAVPSVGRSDNYTVEFNVDGAAFKLNSSSTFVEPVEPIFVEDTGFSHRTMLLNQDEFSVSSEAADDGYTYENYRASLFQLSPTQLFVEGYTGFSASSPGFRVYADGSNFAVNTTFSEFSLQSNTFGLFLNDPDTGSQFSQNLSPEEVSTLGGSSGFTSFYNVITTYDSFDFISLSGGVTASFSAGLTGLMFAAGDGDSSQYIEMYTASGVCSTSFLLQLDSGFSAFGEPAPTVQPGAVEDVSVTVTVGSLPAVAGTVTIADATAPTNEELLKYIVELEAKVQALVTIIETYGLATQRVES